FINQIDSSLFEPGFDIEACTHNPRYPGIFLDKYPNCLHASNTANIHFHGTHTTPGSTGDNVYLQIRPLPRDNSGKLTTTATDATIGLSDFFKDCASQLKQNPVISWPTSWSDLPRAFTDKQKELLMAYQLKYPNQPLRTEDDKVVKDGGWPLYYIGAFPY